MLFHVRMDVNLPHDLPKADVDDILAREKAYAQELQKSGTSGGLQANSKLQYF